MVRRGDASPALRSCVLDQKGDDARQAFRIVAAIEMLFPLHKKSLYERLQDMMCAALLYETGSVAPDSG